MDGNDVADALEKSCCVDEYSQEGHDGSHVLVKSLPGKGRSLVAARDLTAGEEVLVETAYSSVVLDHMEVCHGCFSALRPKHEGGGIPCVGGCGQFWCSEACQTDADRAHKGSAECASLARIDTTILHDGDSALARLFVKLLCQRAAEGGDYAKFEAAVGGLESNPDLVGGDRLSELGMVAESVLDAIPRSAAVDEEELESLLCAEQCNSFGLWRSRPPRLGTLVGFGIFPKLCMLNHSCLPNVTVSQEQVPPRVVLRAHTLRRVGAGEELCISYSQADMRLRRAARREWLAKTYTFDCACALCAAETEGDAERLVEEFERAHRCKGETCTGLVVPGLGGEGRGKCAMCGRMAG